MRIVKELTLCKKRLQERMEQVNKIDTHSLEYDIVLMEIELLEMVIATLQSLIDKRMKLRLSTKTRKNLFSIKPTIN